MDSELARAYNNCGGIHSNREALKKAIALLKPHEEHFTGDHCWNFRMGYSYYYLDQEGRALRYFEKALDARPGDEDTMELIDRCKKGIDLPQFWECFRERTEDWWETFAEMEAQLRQMMDDDRNHTRGAEIVAQMEETLNMVFDEISFEMGFNGEKYELIFTPEGDNVKLFELVYFQKHAPKEILEHWDILVGRQPFQNIGLRTDDGYEVSGEDVQVWLEEQDKNRFTISAYCKKLLPMLREEEGRVWWMLTTLTDQVLGEIPHMRYINSFDVLEEPKSEPSILMSQLPYHLKERGLELSTDPEAYLGTYPGYKMEPNKDPDADWRLDVMAGSTCCIALINGYLNADNDFMTISMSTARWQVSYAIPWIPCVRRKELRRSSTSGINWRKPSLPTTVRRCSSSPAEPPASTTAMWTLFPGTFGRHSKWPRSSSRTVTSPGPVFTPSVMRRVRCA